MSHGPALQCVEVSGYPALLHSDADAGHSGSLDSSGEGQACGRAEHCFVEDLCGDHSSWLEFLAVADITFGVSYTQIVDCEAPSVGMHILFLGIDYVAMRDDLQSLNLVGASCRIVGGTTLAGL